ncbi:NmrA-like family protein (Rossmann-fold NAD(P)(+)-binding protein) [Colletotrichum tofieldiae]|uniref:NmrA-like family protein (Rossmann-fold NAD(P)(+)-binding protein) n=1 Tax=Colletotrichum tofieldiae TaxID=708197 RepID=A0A166R5B9_9PEZI|nr:NmrA-like family protein (Rossmann-fold NAD(P)(+)-binding protein) [Colletotrichum tofieldiae]
MTKIAVAGASGKLALETIDRLAKSGKHEILGLVRKDPSSLPVFTGVTWVQTSYQDKTELTKILIGVQTVISFIVAHTDPGAETAKRLIDSSIEAGVKRFAPSEWATSNKLAEVIKYTPWYANKLEVKRYLEEVNKDRKVIEYTLFQPGAFMNFLAYPRQTAKHYRIETPAFFDFDKGRAFILEGSENAEVTLTTIEDIAEVTARAVEYDGEWPTVGGISGQKVTVGEIIRLGEKIRGNNWLTNAIGKSFEVDRLKLEDLEAGIVKTNFIPLLNLPGMSREELENFTKVVAIGATVSVAREAWAVSDEWNQLLPDFKPTGIEEYAKRVWESN